jgi:hypothetical protein
MRMFAGALMRLAPTRPARTARVGHWRKNDKQTRWVEWRWSLEPADELEGTDPWGPGAGRE